MLPEVSVAVTVITFVPEIRGMGAYQSIPHPQEPFPDVPWLDQATVTTPTSSTVMHSRLRGVTVVVKLGDDVGAVIVTVGGFELAAAINETVTSWFARFPTSSEAVNVIWFVPTARGTVEVQAVVPVASPYAPVVLFTQLTEVTPTLSEAVPKTVASCVGDAKLGSRLGSIAIVGGTVS